jgi:hypothetical protein
VEAAATNDSMVEMVFQVGVVWVGGWRGGGTDYDAAGGGCEGGKGLLPGLWCRGAGGAGRGDVPACAGVCMVYGGGPGEAPGGYCLMYSFCVLCRGGRGVSGASGVSVEACTAMCDGLSMMRRAGLMAWG